MVGLFFLWWPSTHLVASSRCHCLSPPRLDWHLLEVITSCWDLALRCVTIGDIDLVPTLEEYDHFLSVSTPLSTTFAPPMWTHYRKRLTDMMGFKRPIVEALTWYGNGVGGSMSFEFLRDQFHLSECPAGATTSEILYSFHLNHGVQERGWWA